MSARDEAAAILYQALGSQLGLLLETTNVAGAVTQLSRARTATGDAELTRLTFKRNPYNKDQLYVLKGPEGGK